MSNVLVGKKTFVMENDGCVTVAELSDMLDVRSDTVFTILIEHLEMRRIAAR